MFTSQDVQRVYMKRMSAKLNLNKKTAVYKDGNSLVISLSLIKNIVALSGIGYIVTTIFLAIATK